MDTVELAPGYRISRLIRGGWQQHEQPDLDPAEAVAHLHAFADAGITAFETADTYRGVSATLAQFLSERRARGLQAPRIHGRITLPADVGAALAASPVPLDLVQLQQWRPDPPDLLAAARAVSRLGLMNIDVDQIAPVLAAGARPLTVQAQYSLLDRRPAATLAPLCQAHGIGLLAYGPLAGGFLARRWLGRPDPGPKPSAALPFHPEYRVVIEAFGGWALLQRLLAALDAVAARHGVSLSLVALRWVLDRPGVAAALVGASHPSRLQDWAGLWALRLGPADRAAIDAVLADAAGPCGPVGGLERDRDGPFGRAIAARD